MPPPPPLLTADWLYLAMLTYQVDPEVLRPYLPAGLELERYEGCTYASIVAFQFNRTRLLGWRTPGHQRFPEVNLRFYVRRMVDGQWRRGVVFVKEIVARRLVAWIANRVFHEHYVVCPVEHTCRPAVGREGPAVEYRFEQGGRWQAMNVQAAGRSPRCPPAGSLENFIMENYWGYTRRRGGATHEYRVEHRPWRFWPAREAQIDFDFAAVYGRPWAAALAGPPASAILVDGSSVSVFAANKLPLHQAAVPPIPAR